MGTANFNWNAYNSVYDNWLKQYYPGDIEYVLYMDSRLPFPQKGSYGLYVYSDGSTMELIDEQGFEKEVQAVYGIYAEDYEYYERYGGVDEETGSLRFAGWCVDVIYDDNGNCQENVVDDMMSGSLSIKDGYLYWTDDAQGAGENCYFVKE